MTRLGRPADALNALASQRKAAEIAIHAPNAFASEMTPDAVGDQDPTDFRKSLVENHEHDIDSRVKQATDAIGSAIQTYATPEQKSAYAAALETLHTPYPNLAISAAASAGLADREAAWRRQKLLSRAAMHSAEDVSTFVSLEQHRLAFAELAQTLEAYAVHADEGDRPSLRTQAAQAWHDAGDAANELRLQRSLVLADDSANRDRFLDLLLRRDPQALTALASNTDTSLAEAAANYAIEHGSEAQALAAVDAHAKSLPAVWRPASRALVGLYFAGPDSSQDTTFAGFQAALVPNATVAQRLATKPDPSRQLTGDNWFFYASRFGIFVTLAKLAQVDAEDFLPAQLELAPTAPRGYLDLARTYAEAGNAPSARAEYAHALELAPNNPAIHDEIALLEARNHHAAGALAEWRAALGLLAHMVDRNNFPESFYTDFEAVVAHAAQFQQAAALHPEIDAIVRPFVARNGNYRSNELLQAAYTSSPTPAAGVAFVLSLSTAAADPDLVLDDLRNAAWLSTDAKTGLLERQLELARLPPAPGSAYGADPISQTSRREQAEDALLTAYLNAGRFDRAQQLLAAIPARVPRSSKVDRARVLIAAHTGSLPVLLNSFRAAPDSGPNAAPDPKDLVQAANTLAQPMPPARPDPASARLVREYVFEQRQAANTLTRDDFLSLAESRIDTGDLPGALDLLHRLTLLPPSGAAADPDSVTIASDRLYLNFDSAAALLERTHHAADAVPLLATLAAAVPWDATYRLRLAQAKGDSTGLLAVARDTSAAYATRATAAEALAAKGSTASDLGSAELNLLATPHPSAQAARQPYFVAARIAAADSSAKDRAALLREALSIAPNGLDADRLRLDLLTDATELDRSAETLAILNVLQNTSTSAASKETDADDAQGDDSSETTDAEPEADSSDTDAVESTLPSLPALAATLDVSVRIRLAGNIATAYQRNGDDATALTYLELADKLDQRNPHSDEALGARVATLTAAIQLQARNAKRRPILHRDLDQANPVRARLTLAQLQSEEAP